MIRRLLMLLALFTSSMAAAAPADDRRAIEAATAEWIRHYEARDLDALMRLYEPDAFVALNNQPALRGVAAVRGYFAKAFAAPAGKFRLNIEDIQIHGPVAHLVSLFRLDGKTPDGKTWSAVGRSLLIYRRTPGGWKILADIDNSTPDAKAWSEALPAQP